MSLGGVPEILVQFMFIRKFIHKRNLCCQISSPSQVLGESKKCGDPGAVAFACIPSYLGGGVWRIVVQCHPGQRVSKTPSKLRRQVSSQLYPAITLAL
jgi:hypothetical protein